eukprot:COSAG02_NODE_14_length_56855_cov_512.793661_2_plen_50_part_00
MRFYTHMVQQLYCTAFSTLARHFKVALCAIYVVHAHDQPDAAKDPPKPT